MFIVPMGIFKSRKAKRCGLLLTSFTLVYLACTDWDTASIFKERSRELEDESDAVDAENSNTDVLNSTQVAAIENEYKEEYENESQEKSKPVMATFFEPDGSCCGMSESGHHQLLKAWETSWQARGWDTIILTEEDAMKHSDFEMLDQKLSDLNVDPYNRRCFWRWLAMANIEEGGWMSDYDTFPLGLTAEEGLEIAKLPGFKSYSIHVPNIIHADQVAWGRVLSAMIRVFPETWGPGVLVTDMLMLRDAKNRYNDESMMITEWKRDSGSFMYNLPKNETDDLEINCEAARSAKVAHLSHSDCHKAFETYHTYPRLEGGVTMENLLERRGEAALVLMKDYRENCLDNAGAIE